MLRHGFQLPDSYVQECGIAAVVKGTGVDDRHEDDDETCEWLGIEVDWGELGDELDNLGTSKIPTWKPWSSEDEMSDGDRWMQGPPETEPEEFRDDSLRRILVEFCCEENSVLGRNAPNEAES